MGFPRIERSCLIEVPNPRRIGYVWVQGWIVRYSPSRTSIPMRLHEARGVISEFLKGSS